MLDTLELLGIDSDAPIRTFAKPVSDVASGTSISDLLLDISLPKARYATLAGFLLDKAKVAPKPGDTTQYRDIRLTVQRGTARVIEGVKTAW